MPRVLDAVLVRPAVLILWSPSVAPAGENGGKVAGILIDKKDTWLADGEDEPVKYLIAKDADKKLVKALKTIFNASRVQLTYKKDGDSRQLVSIKKQILKASGTVTGVVVKVYDQFWIEVKPKVGPSDAYAPGANYKNKDFMTKLRASKKGDSVTIPPQGLSRRSVAGGGAGKGFGQSSGPSTLLPSQVFPYLNISRVSAN